MPTESRPCVTCSKMHKAATEQCRRCIFANQPPQTCITCGCTFPAAGSKKCWRCRQSFAPKPCIDCGNVFKGSAKRCEPCRAVDRTCACGNTYRDRAHRECNTCRKRTRPCDVCGRTINMLARICGTCNIQQRECTNCGCQFEGTRRMCNTCTWKEHPDYERRLVMAREAATRRRAMKASLRVGLGIDAAAREKIIAGASCVYCDESATETDHVRPLVDGGLDHESNVVPSCTPCNRSKGPRLLTSWHRDDRVWHGIKRSPIVAAEWDRLTALADAG